MKIRTDFVTNSSSSSFIVKLTIRAKGENYSFKSSWYNCEDNGQIFITHSPEELAATADIKELVEMLKDTLLDCCDSKKEIDSKCSFLESIGEIPSVGDIESIEMEGTEKYSGDDGDDLKYVQRYKWSKATGKQTYKTKGEPPYATEGDGGGFDFGGEERRSAQEDY